MLGRKTEWRQGHLLTADHTDQLNLGSTKKNARVLVATHDCDLANDGEEHLEILVGHLVDRVDGMLARARNPRRLHLTFRRSCGTVEHVEVTHAGRSLITREDFSKGATYSDQVSHLDPDDKRALKQWLAARYGRPAFPDAFETRLRQKVGKPTVEQQIGTIAKSCSAHLIGLFFDLGEDRGRELTEGDAYYLSISVVYDATEGGPEARIAAESAASRITELFEKAYGKPDQAVSIVLENCVALADTHMTLADLRKVDQWRLEYVSLTESPPGDFVGQGEASF